MGETSHAPVLRMNVPILMHDPYLCQITITYYLVQIFVRMKKNCTYCLLAAAK